MTRPSRASHRWFLVAVFLGIGFVIGVTFVLYSLQPPRIEPTRNVVFGPPNSVDGNVSFAVANTSQGPYPFTGFRTRLVVNNFAGGPVSLGPNRSATQITIGISRYRIIWTDADGDGAVSAGDSFAVAGDGAPLSSLSDYEFDLLWGNSWTAQEFWSTY